MKWVIRFVSLFITSTTIIQCCENETIIACPRQNMTCLKTVCSCSSRAPPGYFYYRYITCTNVLEDIPADIPKEAWYISMTGNNITTIKAGAFEGLHEVDRLYLSDNKIETIESGAFLGLTGLILLNLQNNFIGNIESETFYNLPQLNVINLQNNFIGNIESEAFYNLPRLNVIYLTGNPINALRTNTFKNLPVQHIDFTGSRIAIIESRSFSNLEYLTASTIATLGSITEVQSEAFFNLSSLEALVLSSRNITEIKPNAFVFLPNLQGINLAYNLLTRIEENTFCNFPVLTSLTVSSNQITILKKKSFCNLPALKHLYIVNNSITDVESEAFYNLPNLEVIYLTDNPIHTILTDAFKNLPVMHIDFTGSRISVIESRAFNNLWKLSILSTLGPITKINSEAFFNLSSLYTLILSSRNITEIQQNAFAYLPKLERLLLDDNSLTRIEENTFCNLPVLTHLVLSINKITVLKKKSFFNLPALQTLILSGNPISIIEQDAFVNVQANTLVIGIDQNFMMNENVQNNFTSIFFTGNDLNCKCSFLWFPLWLKNRPLTTVTGTCSNFNKSVGNLFQEDLKYCYELTELNSSNISQSIELTCTSRYIKSDFQYWIHSQYGTEIRKLSGRSVSPDTNVISIAFCSYEDAGDYTCVRTTNYSVLPEVTFTTKLSVSGPPIILNQSTREAGDNLILSVLFYGDPYNEPDWFLGDTILSTNSEHMISTSPYVVTMNQRLPRKYKGFITNLTIFNYKQFLSKAYTCRIKNIYGEVKEIIISQLVSIYMDRNTFCDTSFKTEIKCSIGFDGAIAGLWTHSYNGQIIRTLSGTVVNNTNILSIPFCSYQDMGDYTRTWNTNVSDILTLNRTSTVVVSGPPLLLDYLITREGNDTILSVFFFSEPFPSEPKWYFQGASVILGYGFDYQQITNFATVTVRQHKRDVNRQGFVSNLTIFHSRSILYGTYTCKIENSFGYLQHDFVVQEAIPPTHEASSPGDISPTIIVSVSVSVVVFFIVIVVIVVCRRRKPNKDEFIDPPMPSSSLPDLYDSIRLSRLQEPSPDYIDVC